MKRWISILTILVLIGACKSPENLSNISPGYQDLYNLNKSLLHPQVVLYHSSDDSSTFYFSLASDELLYTRSQTGMPFSARVKVDYAFKNLGTGALADSGRFELNDYTSSGKQVNLIGSKKLKLAAGALYSVTLLFTDLNRNSAVPIFLQADKDDSFNAQNYLILNTATNEPLFNRGASPGDHIHIESARNGIVPNVRSEQKIQVLYFDAQPKLPPPPFSTNAPEAPSTAAGKAIATQTDSSLCPTFTVSPGFFMITADPQATSGAVVLGTDPSFPAVYEFDQLVGPLRFITSKTEYDEITKNNFPKKLVDRFWMECGGTKPKARELIGAYYERVKEANVFFSTYTEGWRTDRGMIHLIFGNPTKINHYENAELWVYGDEGSPTALSFMFRRVESPFTNNQFVLQRDPMYKQVWEQMVTAWRSGRVYLGEN